MLGRVLDKGSLDGPSVRTGMLSITVGRALERGATLHVRAPKRLQCAHCDGGGCSVCGNSGAFRVAPTAPIVVPIASAISLPARIRVAPRSELGDGVDVVILALRADGPPSDNAWVVPPTAAALAPPPRASKAGRPELTIGLIVLAVLFATVVAISATR